MVSIPPPDPSGAMGSGTVTPAATTSLGRLRRRMLAGLLLIMPFVVTFWIVMSIYSALEGYIISPAARLVVQLVEGRSGGVALPPWFVHFGAPVLGVIGVAVLLLLFGTIARSGLLSLFDRVLLQVPVIKVIHGAVSRVFRFLQGQSSLPEFKRAVLV
ncbi:MAG TPA: DUF502 domain-containing protein, partial [Gemmatales bacterium]|nr:DUF502 domain-containing protein [Gemmatales bacterium]